MSDVYDATWIVDRKYAGQEFSSFKKSKFHRAHIHIREGPTAHTHTHTHYNVILGDYNLQAPATHSPLVKEHFLNGRKRKCKN
jgi:hypothetical protein